MTGCDSIHALIQDLFSLIIYL